MNSQFKRILDLARRTGDRLIVTDPEGQETCVVMSLDAYENLLDKANFVTENKNDNLDAFDSAWNPEMDGDLVDFDEIDEQDAKKTLSNPVFEDFSAKQDDLKQAVERDLEVIENWQKEHGEEKVEKSEEEKQKNNENKQNFDSDEERFYLEPIE